MKAKKYLYWLCLGITLTSALGGCSKTKHEGVSLKLYRLDCGELQFQNMSFFVKEDEGISQTLADSCYLIKHPQGNLLWDTGLPDALLNKPLLIENYGMTLIVHKPLLAQLKEIGIKPQDIGYLGISHFHSDHTGNANNFAHATLLVQEEEYEAAFGSEPEKYLFDPSSYHQLKQSPVKKLQGDYDVFGDGSVIIKRAAGHTPGHQMLFVNLPKTGPLLLSGDLFHYTKNRTFGRVPKINFDHESSLNSIKATEDFLKKKKAQLWIQHDYEQNQKIISAPGFYE